MSHDFNMTFTIHFFFFLWNDKYANYYHLKSIINGSHAGLTETECGKHTTKMQMKGWKEEMKKKKNKKLSRRNSINKFLWFLLNLSWIKHFFFLLCFVFAVCRWFFVYIRKWFGLLFHFHTWCFFFTFDAFISTRNSFELHEQNCSQSEFHLSVFMILWSSSSSSSRIF